MNNIRVQAILGVAVCAASLSPIIARAQKPSDAIVLPSATGTQTETDEYTRYELLAPETASFRIYYELTAAAEERTTKAAA